MAVLPSREAKDFGEADFDYENLSAVREEEIRSRLDDARDELAAMPESELMKARVANLKLELKVYRNEHDSSGAYKFKRFGADIGVAFGAEGSKPMIEKSDEGRFEMDPSMKNRRVVFADLLELDRLNKEGGGHDVGDAGLNAASEKMREIAAKYGDFEIYRSGGNQFMLDMENVSDEDYDKMMAELSAVEVVAKEGIDPAPLVSKGVNFRDAVEDLNVLEHGLVDEGGLAPHEAARELTGLLMRNAEWGSEIAKTRKRAERVKKMIEEDPVKAQGFFENYVKRGFQGTSFETFNGLKKHIDEGTFDAEKDGIAFEQAHARFEIDRAETAANEEEAHRIARKKVIWERSVAHRNGAEARAEGKEGLAVIPKETRGQAELRGKQEAIGNADEELKKAPTEENKEALKKAELEYQLERARRDAGTGLLERGVYYEDLEKTIAEDEPTTTVFVDMGFLKYFDKQGGRDVGNDALKLAASLMEEALIDSGVEGEAYRYGGDEFTILVKGGEDDAKKFLRSLEDLNEKAGAVPPGKKSQDDYVPTGLQFSHGIADSSALRELVESTGKDMGLNQKAELMTRIADTGVQYLKAADRFEYLLGQMTDPEYRDPGSGKEAANDFTKQVESKIAYSNKALFAELGGERILRSYAGRLRDAEALPEEEREAVRNRIDEEIRKFVIERVDASREKEAENKSDIDRLIEMRTRITYLEGELKRLSMQEKSDADTIKELKEEKKKTEKAFADIADVRKKIHD